MSMLLPCFKLINTSPHPPKFWAPQMTYTATHLHDSGLASLSTLVLNYAFSTQNCLCSDTHMLLQSPMPLLLLYHFLGEFCNFYSLLQIKPLTSSTNSRKPFLTTLPPTHWHTHSHIHSHTLTISLYSLQL